jgi:hypothetical protein
LSTYACFSAVATLFLVLQAKMGEFFAAKKKAMGIVGPVEADI